MYVSVTPCHTVCITVFVSHNRIPQYHCLLKISSTVNTTGMVADTAGMFLGNGKFPQGWFHGRRNPAVILPRKSDCLVWVDFKGCLDIPGIAHGVVSFVSESFLDQHFVDVNFFIAFCVPKININGLIPRPRRARPV